jgi:4-diphosphocytidyl-2-C-methyl-D-erythritol kinase
VGRDHPGRGVKLELLAPAKLTLSLRVLGTREDGFHELEALTVSISAPCDTLWVEPGPPGFQLEVGGPAAAGVPDADDNLVARAARPFLPDDEGLVARLEKQIPPGSGLGGGSSDAAAMIRACGEHAFRSDRATMVEVATAIGSDVPVCLDGGPAWMRGRGELLEQLQLPEPIRVLVVVPPFSISTPPVYRAWDDLGGPRSARTIAAPRAVAHLIAELGNDLEPAAERVEPRLTPFREAFEAAAGAPALLAGSGSACWMPFEDEEACGEAKRRVEEQLGVSAYPAVSLAVPYGATVHPG